MTVALRSPPQGAIDFSSGSWRQGNASMDLHTDNMLLDDVLVKSIYDALSTVEDSSHVCQATHRLLEAVDDWLLLRETLGSHAGTRTAEPEAVKELLVTIHTELQALLSRSSDHITSAVETDTNYEDGDPWEDCEDIAAEDLFEWFADSLAPPAPQPASASFVRSPAKTEDVQHVPLSELLNNCFERQVGQEDLKVEDKEGRISTVSTAASMRSLGSRASFPPCSNSSTTSVASLSTLQSHGNWHPSVSLPLLHPTSTHLQPQRQTSTAPSHGLASSQDWKPIRLIPKFVVAAEDKVPHLVNSTPEEEPLDDWEEEFLRRASMS